MRRNTDLWIAIVGLLLVSIAIGAMLWFRSVHRWAVERAELVAALERADESQAGGAEVDPPEPERQSGEWTFPVHPGDYLALTSPYGYRVSPVLNVELWHQGVDIAATWRAQVVAAADGVVVEHWPAPGTRHPSGAVFRGHEVYGAMITLEHADGWRTLYAHMDSTRIRTGQTVRAGEVLGRIGSTGQSRGAHVHFEMIDPTGERVNPLLFVSP